MFSRILLGADLSMSRVSFISFNSLCRSPILEPRKITIMCELPATGEHLVS